jgi:hypothetical protein
VEQQLYVYADGEIDAGQEFRADHRTRCWYPQPLCAI